MAPLSSSATIAAAESMATRSRAPEAKNGGRLHPLVPLKLAMATGNRLTSTLSCAANGGLKACSASIHAAAPPPALDVRHDLERESCLPAAWWTEDFANAAARQPPAAGTRSSETKPVGRPTASLECKNVSRR
jgi:hypothetical protein